MAAEPRRAVCSDTLELFFFFNENQCVCVLLLSHHLLLAHLAWLEQLTPAITLPLVRDGAPTAPGRLVWIQPHRSAAVCSGL